MIESMAEPPEIIIICQHPVKEIKNNLLIA
jgi:hypothetical protein